MRNIRLLRRSRHNALPDQLLKRTSMERLAGAALLAILLVACGGGGDSTPAAPATPVVPVPPTLTLGAAVTQTIVNGKPVGLSATVSSSDSVNWALSAGAPGSLSATTGASVNYLPPASGMTAPVSVTVTASAGGTSKSTSLTVYADPGPAGLSLVAGEPTGKSSIDGQGAAARFAGRSNLTSDAAGNVYFVDNDNASGTTSIRKITPDGNVTTLTVASKGSNDGDSRHAQLGDIYGLSMAPDGTLYVLDQNNLVKSLRTVAADGSVKTLFSKLALPDYVYNFHAAGNGIFYLRDNTSIIRVNADGSSSVLAGRSDNDGASTPMDGKGGAATFRLLNSMTLTPGGDLFVIDDSEIRKITPDGTVSTPWPQTGPSASRHYYLSVLAEPDGSLLLYDMIDFSPGKLNLRRVAPAGEFSEIVQFANPLTYTYSGVLPAVYETRKGAILIGAGAALLQLSGTTLVPFAGVLAPEDYDTDGVGAAARFAAPAWLASDANGNVYVTDNSYSTDDYHAHGLVLRKITPAGQVTTLVSKHAFGVVTGIVLDRNGTIYVSNGIPNFKYGTPGGGGAISRIAADGSIVTLKNGSGTGTLDTAANAFGLYDPTLLGIDADGNLYLRDGMGCCTQLRKMAPDGTLTSIASLPAGLGVAPDGAIYKVDSANSVVYRIDANGDKSVVAGVSGVNGTLLGSLPGGLLKPVAVVPTGLYSFAVISGNAILKLVLPH